MISSRGTATKVQNQYPKESGLRRETSEAQDMADFKKRNTITAKNKSTAKGTSSITKPFTVKKNPVKTAPKKKVAPKK